MRDRATRRLHRVRRGRGPEPGEEEPRVESDGRVRRGNRPSEVGEPPERRRDAATPHLVEGPARRVPDVTGGRDHDSGLLVRLAHGRDAERGGGGGIPANPHGPEMGQIERRRRPRPPIRLFHRPAGKHEVARQKLRVGVTASHQTQGVAVAGAHHDQSRGVAWSNRRGGRCVVHRRSLVGASFPCPLDLEARMRRRRQRRDERGSRCADVHGSASSTLVAFEAAVAAGCSFAAVSWWDSGLRVTTR